MLVVLLLRVYLRPVECFPLRAIMANETEPLPWSRRARYWTSDFFLRNLIRFAGLVPYGWRVPMMGWLTARLAPLAGYDKRVRANLAHACPGLPEAEIRHLCRAVPDNAGRTMIELYAGRPFLEHARAAPITGPGFAALEAARADGRPVILMTGHIGNYLAGRAGLAARGFKMGVLYRRMSNPYFNAHYVAALRRTGEPLFEQGPRGMIAMVRHLRAGGMIAIVGDTYVHGGAPLRFFGQVAPTSIVPAELAVKYGAALIPAYALRAADGLNFDMVVQEEIPHSDPLTMTQAINDGLEQVVRAHMDQWFWIHRRWKPWLTPSARGPAPEE